MKDEAPVLAELARAGLADARVVLQPGGRFEASGQGWAAVALGELGREPLWLRLPQTARGQVASDGSVSLDIDPLDAEVLEEGRAFVASLLAHGQLLKPGDAPRRSASHELVVEPDGRRCLRRRGFA